MLNIQIQICGPSISSYKQYIYISSIFNYMYKKYPCIPVDYMYVGLYSRKLLLDIVVRVY